MRRMSHVLTRCSQLAVGGWATALLIVTVAGAAINPADPGLAHADAYGQTDIANNGASALCVQCHGESGEGKLLAGCYRSALDLAAQNGLSSIAFPAISTGIYGFPPDRAALIAVRTVRETLPDVPTITRVVFCCFGEESRALHEAALAATANA